jgi:hypothetical protein
MDRMVTGGLDAKMAPLLDREFGPDIYDIEKGMVRRFLEAIEDDDPRWETETPSTFPCALPPRTLLHEILNVELPLTRVLNGSSELEYRRPIHIGDRISVTGRLVRVKETVGSLILLTEITWTKQTGEVAVTGKNTYIRY